MAKCSICNTRKGKRKCLISDGLICSLCCGTTRQIDSCTGCGYYHAPKRKYNDVPRYTPQEMNDSHILNDYSRVFESTLYAYDMNNGINDEIAIMIYELLLDKYYFNDTSPKTGNKLVDEGFTSLDIAVKKDLKNAPKEEIIKVIAVLRFVAKRRTRNGREYMQVVEQFVGGDMGRTKLSPFNFLFRKLKQGGSSKLLK